MEVLIDEQDWGSDKDSVKYWTWKECVLSRLLVRRTCRGLLASVWQMLNTRTCMNNVRLTTMQFTKPEIWQGREQVKSRDASSAGSSRVREFPVVFMLGVQKWMATNFVVFLSLFPSLGILSTKQIFWPCAHGKIVKNAFKQRIRFLM